MLNFIRTAANALFAITGSVVGGVILGLALVIAFAITVAVAQVFLTFAGVFFTASLPLTLVVLAVGGGLLAFDKVRNAQTTN